MPLLVDYDIFMFSYLHWNIYLGPLLLGIGIFLQIYFFFRPQITFYCVIFAASLISIVSYMDSDIVLFVGQLLIVPLLWQHKLKSANK